MIERCYSVTYVWRTMTTIKVRKGKPAALFHSIFINCLYLYWWLESMRHPTIKENLNDALLETEFYFFINLKFKNNFILLNVNFSSWNMNDFIGCCFCFLWMSLENVILFVVIYFDVLSSSKSLINAC
jgi:hypothetical protein